MMRTIIAVIGLTLLSACQSTKVNEEQFSGYLTDYSNMSYSRGDNTYTWVDSSKVSQYSAIKVDPVAVYPKAQANTAIATQATNYLQTQFTQLLRDSNKLAGAPGAGVLRLQSAITSVSKQTEGMKVYELLPVAAVYKGVQAAAGGRASYIDVSFEAQLVDSTTGQVVATLVERAVGETDKTSSDGFEFNDTKVALDHWVKRLNTFIDRNLN